MTRTTRAVFWLAALSLAGTLTGCSGLDSNRATPVRRPSILPQRAYEAATDHPLAPFGTPELRSGFTQPPTTFIERDGWIALHSDVDLIPLWVCERIDQADTIDPSDLDPDAEETDRKACSWASDPQLGDGLAADDDDYTGATTGPSTHDKLARGHMAPAEDFNFSQSVMCETFFFTNAVPQNSSMNSGVWAQLEGRCRDAAVARGSVFVITGPMFYDPVDDDDSENHDPDNDDDIVEYYVVGDHGVAVPTHVYKIVVDARDVENPSAIAFVLENVRQLVGDSPPRFSEPYVQSIDWIEDRTGIDFLPLLDEFINDADEFEENPGSLDAWPEFQPHN